MENELPDDSQKEGFLHKLRLLRQQIDGVIEGAMQLWWHPRTYDSQLSSIQYTLLPVDEKSWAAQQKEFAEMMAAQTVPAKTSAYVIFGEEAIIHGTAFPGLPGTEAKYAPALVRDFEWHHLEIEDAVAPNFDVLHISVNGELLWSHDVAVPASKFAASAPTVVLNRFAVKRGIIQLFVNNTTDQPQVFRAKVVGREPAYGVIKVPVLPADPA